MTLKSNIRVFVGIPNLSNDDRYKGYIGSVLNHLQRQVSDFEIMKPYITPPHAGRFHEGSNDRLYAIMGRMNDIIDKFMASDASHVFINDGDIEVPPNGVDTLLRHDVDVASGVYPSHSFYSNHAMSFGRMVKTHQCGNFIPRDWEFMKGKVFGEEEPWSGGSGCMLIKRRVFNKYHPNIPALRFSKDDDCGADKLFWKRCYEAGFSTRVDARIVCGHMPDYRLKDIDEWLK